MDINLRGLHPDLLAELSGGFFPVILIEVDWPGDPAFAHTGLGAMTFNGQAYTGIGAGSFDLALPEEGGGLSEFQGQLAVDYQVEWFEQSGVDQEEYVLDADTQDRVVRVLFGATTERAGNVLIGDATEFFRGTMDGFRDIQEQDRRRLEIDLRGGPGQRSVSNVIHTNASQQDEQPGDTIMRWVEGAEKRVTGVVRW